MRKISIRLAVGLLTLALGLAAASIWSYFFNPLTNIPRGWREVDTRLFTFHVPPDMQYELVPNGREPYLYFHNKDVHLRVEYGPDVAFLYGFWDQAEYYDKWVEIGKHPAKLYSFHATRPVKFFPVGPAMAGEYTVGLGLPDLEWTGHGSTLMMWAQARGPEERQLAEKIFATIKVK